MDGKQVKETRLTLRLSQGQFADMVGYSKHAIISMEHGRRSVPEKFHTVIAQGVKKWLDCTIKDCTNAINELSKLDISEEIDGIVELSREGVSSET